MSDLFLKERYHSQLTDIFNHCCPNAVIWAYGSRVGGNAHSGSDLDLAIKDLGENSLTVPMIRAVLDESTLPFRVDLHVFDWLPKSFQEEIERKYIVFYGEGKQITAKEVKK